MIKRRDLITLLGGAAAAWPLAARAQQPNPLKRVAWCGTEANDALSKALVLVLQQELQKFGWTVGRNLEFDGRVGAGEDRSIRIFAAELLSQAPDVILTTGTQVTAIFQEMTRTIPIVFVNVADPVVSGFVTSFARPGGNITGFTNLEYSLAGKWLSILKDVAPGITRVMMLFSPENSNWTGYLATIEAAAPSFHVYVSAARVISTDEVVRQVQTFARDPGGGMIVQPSGFMAANRKLIVDLAVQHRLPAIYPFEYFAESGGLVSYGTNTFDIYRRAAVYVDRILRGAKPADLPVQAPVKFEFVINLKAAKAIGIEVPYNVLLLADRVID